MTMLMLQQLLERRDRLWSILPRRTAFHKGGKEEGAQPPHPPPPPPEEDRNYLNTTNVYDDMREAGKDPAKKDSAQSNEQLLQSAQFGRERTRTQKKKRRSEGKGKQPALSLGQGRLHDWSLQREAQGNSGDEDWEKREAACEAILDGQETTKILLVSTDILLTKLLRYESVPDHYSMSTDSKSLSNNEAFKRSKRIETLRNRQEGRMMEEERPSSKKSHRCMKQEENKTYLFSKWKFSIRLPIKNQSNMILCRKPVVTTPPKPDRRELILLGVKATNGQVSWNAVNKIPRTKAK